jgi:Flp pilus assembly protein TadG
MTGSIQLRNCCPAGARSAFRDERAAQLVEFAVALPLLVVFVVGIFDFSGAFTLKQKLTNAARDAARVAAADPASDIKNAKPLSVNDAFNELDNYLHANQINNCGVSLSGSPTNLIWNSTASSGGCTITVIINRGYYFPSSGAILPSVTCTAQTPSGVALVGTCVSVQYTYPWRFGRVASLLGESATLPSSISAVAVALNEN